MPVEFEDHTERVREHLHEHADEHANGGHGGGREKWVMGVALTSAILAALAAVAALLAGFHANEAMIEQIKASDQWNYYQAKSIKESVLRAKGDVLTSLGRPVTAEDAKDIERYEAEQQDIYKEAKGREEVSHAHLKRHVILARAVTLFQVAIAVAAIAVLTRLRWFWGLGILVGLLGLGFMVQGLLVAVGH